MTIKTQYNNIDIESKKVAVIALAAVLLAFLFTARAMAQILPDSIFNEGPKAFGNTVQDAPPDILKVRISPKAPVAGKAVTVEAVIATDEWMSAFRVVRAELLYSTDKQSYKTVEMKLKDRKNSVWAAAIPAFPAGTTVYYSLAGWDEVGNTVYQIPLQQNVSRDELFKVVTDEDDTDIQPGMDVLTMWYGTDGTVMHYCQELEATFQTYAVMSGVSISVMGFVEEDARAVRHRSYIENMVPFLAYIPALNIAGKLLPEDFAKMTASKEGGISVTGKGKRVCAKAPISQLTKTPARGLKVYSATAAFDPKTSAGVLMDASPYAILYFGGASYTVK